MKARFPGTCKECNNPWYKDAEIARWLGSWVHDGCRTQAVAAKRSEGSVTTLPDARGFADQPSRISSKTIRLHRIGKGDIITQ